MKFAYGAALAAALFLAGCHLAPDSPAGIDVQPSYAVRYATQAVSPAVVQLNIVIQNYYQGQARPSNIIGSGFIIDPQGHVLTNFHVAGRASRIQVTLANQEHVRATLVGSDHWTDLALVQLDMDDIHRRNLTFESARLGDSAAVQLGQPVMAVGTPYGLSRTITAGIISNTDRAFDEATIDGYETGWFNNWLQTDAAINPGNSGGPLINLRGEVIGINTRGISEGNNLGFAIPIDTAKAVVREILAHGKVARSYIGIQLQPLQDFEQFYGLQRNQGVLVANVENDSPAFRAGLKVQDILLAVDGQPVSARFPEQIAAVRKLISDRPIGSTLTLTVRRPATGTMTTMAATAGPATARTEPISVSLTTERLESVVTEESAIDAWGITVRDLTRAYLRDTRLPYMKGVLLTGARPGSPAERAQVQVGDIILRVDDKPVTTAEELHAAIEAWQKNPRPVGVDVYRGRGAQVLVVKP